MEIICLIVLMMIVLMIFAAALWFFVEIVRKKEKRIHILLLPVIFTILLFVPVVPGVIVETAPHEINIIWQLYAVMLISTFLIWIMLFSHISLGIYSVMLVIYTTLSWIWILKRKKGSVVYAIVWIVLCTLSILLYWKCGDIYHAMLWI